MRVIWVWVVVVVVVIGAAAVLVAGREDEMAEVYDDRPDVAFPAGRAMTVSDLDRLRFSTAVRGYRMDEVDAFVARVKAELISREGHEGVERGHEPALATDGSGAGEEPAGVRGEPPSTRGRHAAWPPTDGLDAAEATADGSATDGEEAASDADGSAIDGEEAATDTDGSATDVDEAAPDAADDEEAAPDRAEDARPADERSSGAHHRSHRR